MNIVLAERLLAQVQQRVSEGDNPQTPALPTETLEHLVLELARQRHRTRDDLPRPTNPPRPPKDREWA
jgi:hypothetical protein